MEMTDSSQQNCGCGPQELVAQTHQAARNSGIPYGGENALVRYDTSAYAQVESESPGLLAFYYLRLCSDLMTNDVNWSNFCQFVTAMGYIS